MNAAFHKYLVEGVPIPYRVNGEPTTFKVHLIDFENLESNDFKVINQYTIIEYKNKRPDVLVFINGIPIMEKIRKMKHKNIAAEMLRKLLEDNIHVFARTGVVKSKLFSEKMQQLLKAYNNRLITNAEVIEELLNLSKEMAEAYHAGDEK